MEANYVVIKVKYGDMLRRFNALVVHDELDICIDGLRKKIISLFSFPLDTELMLTYVDEDGDVVTLGDDDDLRDVVKQALNPLRITVELIEEKNYKQKKLSGGSSSPLVSSPNQQPQQNLNSDVLEYLRNVPEPVRETFVKLSADLASKASSTSPFVTQIADLFSRVCSSYLGQLSLTQREKHSTTEAGASESSKSSTKTNDLVDSDLTTAMNALLKIASKHQQTISMQSFEKLKPEENVETNYMKFDYMDGGKSDGFPSKSYNYGAVAAALNSSDVDVSSQGLTLKHPKANPVSGVGKKGKLQKEKARRIIGSYVSRRKHHFVPNHVPGSNKHWFVKKSDENSLVSYKLPAVFQDIATEKDINDMPNHPKLATNPDSGSVSEPPSRGHLGSRVKSPNPFRNPDTVGPIIPEFSPGPIAKNDTSFSASSVQNVSAIPPHPLSQPLSLVRSTRLRNATCNVVHLGVGCDSCSLCPITGPRFKSRVKVDYDLCDICFQEIGNRTDYIRLDDPIACACEQSLGGLIDAHAKGSDPTLPNASMGSKVKQAESRLDSRFVQDVNISDGTAMSPLVGFTKIWRMRNNGTVVWPQKTLLVWVGGDKLSNVLSVEINVPLTGLMIDQELDVAVDLITPELPGRYISYWRLASPSGQKFGQRIWVLIQVYASMEKMPLEIDGGFNFNLPPINSRQTTNINQELTTEDIKFGPNISKKPGERTEPQVGLKQNTEHELAFPINGSLLAGNGASNIHPSSTSSVSYPIIDLSYLTHTAPPENSYTLPRIPMRTTYAPESAVASPEDNLLRQLKKMGFNNVALNKEVSRLSGYNLAKAVRILTGHAFP